MPVKLFELGAHDGSDTARMAALPKVAIHAFETDRVQPSTTAGECRSNVRGRLGSQRAPAVILSKTGWGGHTPRH